MIELASGRGVVFVTDAGYVLPALRAAGEVVHQVRDDAQVFIMFLGLSDAERFAVDFACVQESIRPLFLERFTLPDGVRFNKTHVSAAALARLSVFDRLPPEVDEILYLDGDVVVVGDIRPLVLARVPDGCVLAGRDRFWLHKFGRGRADVSYLEGISTRPRDYINSGVLKFGRSTWAEVAPIAFKYYLNNSERCKFHDQSALNAVLGDRLVQLDPIYNFITDFTLCHGWRRIGPVILHFTGPLKPWQRTSSWRRGLRTGYVRLVEDYPELSIFADLLEVDASKEDAYESRRRKLHVFSGHALIRRLQLMIYRRRFKGQPFLSII